MAQTGRGKSQEPRQRRLAKVRIQIQRLESATIIDNIRTGAFRKISPAATTLEGRKAKGASRAIVFASGSLVNDRTAATDKQSALKAEQPGEKRPQHARQTNSNGSGMPKAPRATQLSGQKAVTRPAPASQPSSFSALISEVDEMGKAAKAKAAVTAPKLKEESRRMDPEEGTQKGADVDAERRREETAGRLPR